MWTKTDKGVGAVSRPRHLKVSPIHYPLAGYFELDRQIKIND